MFEKFERNSGDNQWTLDMWIDQLDKPVDVSLLVSAHNSAKQAMLFDPNNPYLQLADLFAQLFGLCFNGNGLMAAGTSGTSAIQNYLNGFK